MHCSNKYNSATYQIKMLAKFFNNNINKPVNKSILHFVMLLLYDISCLQ